MNYDNKVVEVIKKVIGDVGGIYGVGTVQNANGQVAPGFITYQMNDKNAAELAKQLVEELNKVWPRDYRSNSIRTNAVTDLKDYISGRTCVVSLNTVGIPEVEKYLVSKEEMDLYAMASMVQRNRCDNPMELIEKMKELQKDT